MPAIELNKASLHFQRYGRGEHIVLAFHGYGQESSHFATVAQALGSECSVFAFDLFFHGKSKLPKDRSPLQKSFLADLVRQFLLQEQVGRFSVMAFSMGGKFALALIEAFASQIDQVWLVAPDGIKTNFWYNMATYPGWLQGLFKRTVLRPAPFFKFVGFLDRHKVVNKGLLRFANWHMESTPKRLRVYRSWMGFSQLTFDIRKIVRLLNENRIRLVMFLGEFDQVIPQHSLQVFIRSLETGRVVVLKTGHTYLLHDVAAYLRQHPELLR